MRGWLASGLLAAAVIGGYLGLLPLLSSLASGPSWPDPIATREAATVITAPGPAGGESADSVAPAADETSEPVRANPQQRNDKAQDKAETEQVVPGDIVRVEKPKKKSKPSNGGQGGGSSSGGSVSGGSVSGGSSGSSGGGSVTPAPSGGSGGGGAAPADPTPAGDPWADASAGQLASPQVDNAGADDEVIAGG